MKMLTLISLLVTTSIVLGKTVSVTVLDENHQPVTNAQVRIWHFTENGKSKGQDLEPDEDGQVSADIYIEGGFGIRIKSAGFYDTDFGVLPPTGSLTHTAVLRRTINPMPLYALDQYYAARKIPSTNVWVGYDFEVGDWVTPYGKGKTTDIRFRFNHVFRGYNDGIKNLEEEIAFSKRAFAARNEVWTEVKFKEKAGKWDAELEISFLGEKEGLIEEKIRFLTHSKLKMPHEAPADGYRPTWRYTANNYSPTTVREDAGFFLRTRVKLDESGRIVSANYAKIMGDIRVIPSGGIAFTYYYNPTPNDRNLEFDPSKNLFPHDPYGAFLAPDP